MAMARLRVEAAGPLTTIQDGGRPGFLRFGVARSGPIDRLAFAAAQVALGQPAGATAIELAPGGIALRCIEGSIACAVTGGAFAALLNGKAIGSWVMTALGPGDLLTVRDGPTGNWGYVAFAGDLQAAQWLGSTATHAPAGLGGGVVKAGATLIVENARAGGAMRTLATPAARTGPFRIVLGPQERYFTAAALAALTAEAFATTAMFDRMGMVLAGPSLVPTALDMLSEPLVRGAVQLNGKGVATVLLADHQTTGGYPRIATVIGADVDRLAQCRAGDPIRFAAVDPMAAVAAARARDVADRAYLAGLGQGGTLTERLQSANLIDGVIDAVA